jgi:histidine triad (HIT) family protein
VPSDCLFCKLYAEGDHVRKADGFAAIKDINPRAETHLLVIPERHVDTFRDVGEFPADETQRMLEFVAVNVGPGGGQTIFHLHWHLLGGAVDGESIKTG